MSWLSIKGPNGWLAWDIGSPTRLQLEQHLIRCRIAAGIEAGTPVTPEMCPALHEGTPHVRFFAHVQTRPVAELSAITRAQVDAWVAADRAARQAERVAEAARVVADLSAQERALLSAQLGASSLSATLSERT